VCVYPVGGIRWLEQFGQGEAVLIKGRSGVRSIRWSGNSRHQYQAFVSQSFDRLVARIRASGGAGRATGPEGNQLVPGR